MYYVYILKWEKRHYIGYTNNLERRMWEHGRKEVRTSRIIKVNKLLGYFEKETEEESKKLEKMMKRDGHIRHWIGHSTFIKDEREIR